MAYYINLFSPETYCAFTESDRNVSGFRERHKRVAAAIRPGDKLICYMTRLSRWVGILEVTSDSFRDDTPIFRQPDPFIVRFRVSPQVWLEPEQAIPIRHDVCWKHLSFTKDSRRNSSAWTAMVRSSLRRLSDEDGRYLEKLLEEQREQRREYPLSAEDRQKLQPPVVNAEGGQIVVSLPDDAEEVDNQRPRETEHVQIQTKIAEIGDKMGFKIWLPRSDRQRVLENWRPSSEGVLLEQLPLNYNKVALKIIGNIDVLWIRRNSIVHAFEVEHSTSIYSGILRMADLMSLVPNLSIKAHIVAPISRRGKVLEEISRPVFALLGSGPMSESCTYLSYEAITQLRNERNLHHLNDSVLEEYMEYAQEADF